MTSRPTFALAYYNRTWDADGSLTQCRGRRYFQTLAGARAAYRLGHHYEGDDGESWAQIEHLAPGKVYDGAWVDGLAWAAYRPPVAAPPIASADEIPF
jgi:hypothetical protein